MTITQTVEIPENRRLYLNLEIPRDVQAKKAFVTVQFPIPAEEQPEAISTLPDKKQGWRWLYGCCKDFPHGSVDEFLAKSHEDKEYELAIEKRQEEERARLANAKLPS